MVSKILIFTAAAMFITAAILHLGREPERPNVCIKRHWATYVSPGRMGRDQRFPILVCDESIRAENLDKMRGWKWRGQ